MQSYSELELIVIDDASNDGTADLIRSYSDKRIRYLRHERNTGAAGARNTGINNSRGAYIAFQDSDVVWDSEKLKIQMEVMDQREEIDVVYCAIEKISNSVRYQIPSFWVKRREGNILQELLKWNFVDTPAALVRSSAIELFDSTLPFLEDWELFLRLASKCSFGYVDQPLVTSHYTDGGVNEQDDMTTAKTLTAIIERHHRIHLYTHRELAEWYRRIGYHYLVAGRLDHARTMSCKSLRHSITDLKALALMAACIGPQSLRQLVINRRNLARKNNPIGFPRLG